MLFSIASCGPHIPLAFHFVCCPGGRGGREQNGGLAGGNYFLCHRRQPRLAAQTEVFAAAPLLETHVARKSVPPSKKRVVLLQGVRLLVARLCVYLFFSFTFFAHALSRSFGWHFSAQNGVFRKKFFSAKTKRGQSILASLSVGRSVGWRVGLLRGVLRGLLRGLHGAGATCGAKVCNLDCAGGQFPRGNSRHFPP